MEVTPKILKESVENPDFILEEREDKQWNYYVKAFDTGVLFVLAKAINANRSGFEINNCQFVKRR